MKPLPLKVDNYLLERIQEEARVKGITKAEVVRSALIYYLTSREDREEGAMIRSRLSEPDIPERQVLARLTHHKAKSSH